MPNRLVFEASPYLRQHADQPVDWLPWGELAWEKARALQKPILLSSGYSTCHWCHVMAAESFSDPSVAARLNRDFIPVKLDREEHPDVDHLYMTYVQATTGRGGWPLNVFLTPDLRPFFGGTYFPPADRPGLMGFPNLLDALSALWRDRRRDVEEEASRILAMLQCEEGAADTGRSATPRALAAAFAALQTWCEASFDEACGGFGGAPKFPRPAAWNAWLCRAARVGCREAGDGMHAVAAASFTLTQMARGGIHDRVGGGFHRYSVDAAWKVPHFEKMLYDQAQLVPLALQVWQATRDERHAWLARDVLSYVLRDLAAPEGGFYAAEDADSARPDDPAAHAEGAFYLWTAAELRALLGADYPWFASHFNVRDEGNIPPKFDAHGDFAGRNILDQTRPLSATATAHGLSHEAAGDRLADALARLFAARAHRPRPHRDEKIVVAWNGMFLSALARASLIPSPALAEMRDTYLDTARALASALLERWHAPLPAGLCRSLCSDRRGPPAVASDYAASIQGLLDTYEATGEARWLEGAKSLQAEMDDRFLDAEGGGYFESAANAPGLLLRLKEDYDGAEPTSNSLAALNLLRLSLITEDPLPRQRALALLGAFAERWETLPQAMPQLLCALDFAGHSVDRVELSGGSDSSAYRAFLDVLHEDLVPRRVLVYAPFSHAAAATQRPTAQVCRGMTCLPPARTPEELRAALATQGA